MTLLHDIEHYLRSSGTPPTRFGRDAVGDPQFVHDLRRGREPGARIADRVQRYLAVHMADRGDAR